MVNVVVNNNNNRNTIVIVVYFHIIMGLDDIINIIAFSLYFAIAFYCTNVESRILNGLCANNDAILFICKKKQHFTIYNPRHDEMRFQMVYKIMIL